MHKHHLKPKHIGGTNDPSNLLEVTVEDHATIHLAHWIAYGRWQDRVAWQGLAGIISNEEAIRQTQIEGGKKSKSKEQRLKQSLIMKGRPGNHTKKHTAETKQKMRINHDDFTGDKNPFFGKHHSEETKMKVGKASGATRLGKKRGPYKVA